MPPPQPSIVRVIDLETTGPAPPAHGVCEVGWQDVALGADGRWELSGEGGHLMVNPGRPMPPITQAIHHILDEEVADAPLWHDLARPILDPWPRRVALAAHRASFESQFCTPALTHGADWICTWKCALRLWPDSPSFSNQVLRYWRKPASADPRTRPPRAPRFSRRLRHRVSPSRPVERSERRATDPVVERTRPAAARPLRPPIAARNGARSRKRASSSS